MRIENNQLINIASSIECPIANPLVQERGTYQIQSIQDCGRSIIIYFDSIEKSSPSPIYLIKIYVDKEQFKSFFAQGDIVTLYTQIPEEGFQETEFQGKPVNNTNDFLVNASTLHKSELFYPWDPMD